MISKYQFNHFPFVVDFIKGVVTCPVSVFLNRNCLTGPDCNVCQLTLHIYWAISTHSGQRQ